MRCSPAIVPKAALFITTHTGAIPISTAVAMTLGLEPKAPSPTRAIAGRPVPADATPRTAAGPNPIVENPPGVWNESGLSTGYCWATPFLFHPTSVTRMASGMAARTSARIRSGSSGNSADVALTVLSARNDSRSRHRPSQS